MKTIYNNSKKEEGVFVGGDRHVLIAAGGSRELENDIAEQAVAQAQKDGILFSFTPNKITTLVSMEPITDGQMALLRRLEKLGQQGILIPLALLGEDDLMSLKKPTLLKIAEVADCPPLLNETTPKQAIVDEILEALTRPNAPLGARDAATLSSPQPSPAPATKPVTAPTPLIPSGEGKVTGSGVPPSPISHQPSSRPPAGLTSGPSADSESAHVGSTPTPATNLHQPSPASPAVKPV